MKRTRIDLLQLLALIAGVLLWLSLPEVPKPAACDGGGCPEVICSADKFCNGCRCVDAPIGHCVLREAEGGTQ